jgi:hypothetical protein
MQVDLGGLDVLVSKPQRDHRGVDAGVQQSHCRGMPQDMHGHRFLHQRRTDAGGHLHVFGEPMFESVATERFAGARHEERSPGQSGALGKPAAQGGDQARRERGDPLLSSFSLATHMCAGCEMDIGTSKADQLRCSQARLRGETEERVVTSVAPLLDFGEDNGSPRRR